MERCCARSWLVVLLALMAFTGCNQRMAGGSSSTEVQAWIHAQPGMVAQEFVFDHSPSAMCHASTIAEVHGTLVAAWFGGDHEKDSRVVIWSSHTDLLGH